MTFSSPFHAPLLWELRGPASSSTDIWPAEALRAALLELLPADNDGGLASGDAIGQCACTIMLPVERQIGVLVPRSLTERQRRALAGALREMQTGTFGGNHRLGQRVSAAELTRSARVWRTLTPYVGDGYATGPSEHRKLLRRSLRFALFPGFRPEVQRERLAEILQSVELREARDWPRSRPVPEHARVVFREPIRGPFVVGGRRHVGMGLLAPAARQP